MKRSLHARVRLVDCAFEHDPDGGHYARVVVSWDESGEFVGEGRSQDPEHGPMRAAADATAQALVAASDGLVKLDVLAVKAVDGYDTVIVVVSLASEVAGVTERLVGSCLIRGQPERGAVLAVLSGTNRLFGKVVNS